MGGDIIEGSRGEGCMWVLFGENRDRNGGDGGIFSLCACG